MVFIGKAGHGEGILKILSVCHDGVVAGVIQFCNAIGAYSRSVIRLVAEYAFGVAYAYGAQLGFECARHRALSADDVYVFDTKLRKSCSRFA